MKVPEFVEENRNRIENIWGISPENKQLNIVKSLAATALKIIERQQEALKELYRRTDYYTYANVVAEKALGMEIDGDR